MQLRLPVASAGAEPRQWTATLCIKRPDGALHNLLEGVATAPSCAAEVVVPLGDVCVELAPDTELTVFVAGGSFPRWEPPRSSAAQTVRRGATLEPTAVEAL